MPRPLAALVVVLVLALALSGCVGDDGTGTERLESVPELVEVPPPVLDAVEPSVREQIEAAQNELTAAGDDARRPDDELATAYGELARTYHAYEFLESADPAYTNARRLAPSDFRWAYLQGLVREELGRKEQALDALSRALELDPAYLPARLRRAALLQDLGRTDRALGELRAVVSEDGDVALAHYYLAQLAADRGDWQQAAESYERVLELQPGASRVRYPLSRVYQRLGRPDDAERQALLSGNVDVVLEDPLLGRLTELKQGAAALVRRGAVAQIDGDWRAAAAAYRLAVEADPESVEARMSLGGALAQLGDLPGAEEHLRRAVELDPSQALAWYNLAGVLRNQGRFDEALDVYEKALRLSPEDSKFLLARAQTQADAGRADAARDTYGRLLDLDPESVDAAFGLAALDASEDRLAAAAGRLRALLRRDLDDGARRIARLRLAHLEARAEATESALTLYEQVLESLESESGADSPQAPSGNMAAEAQLGRANLLGATGRFREAAEAYRVAARLAPSRVEAWLGGATALVLIGDWVGARGLLEEGLRAPGDKADLQHTLARLLATAPDPRAREGELALSLARAALGQGGSVDYAETVGMALAELGRWQEAVDWQQRVIDQLETAGQEDRATAARALQELYRRRQPVRQSATD